MWEKATPAPMIKRDVGLDIHAHAHTHTGKISGTKISGFLCTSNRQEAKLRKQESNEGIGDEDDWAVGSF